MKYNTRYLVVWICLSWVVSTRADWPQWMGPDRNGRIRGEHLPQELDSQLQPAWRRAVGHGYAAPVVSGNDLIWVDEINDKEVAHCLALEGGKERWATPYADSYTDEFEPGPRCTPLIDEDRIYVQSCRGEFRCLNRKDGSVRWGFRFEDYGAFWVSERQANVGAANRRGHSGSPVISGDTIIVQVGSTNGASLVAFNKVQGKLLWKSQNDLTCYSSAIVGVIDGVQQCITATCEGLLGVAVADGKLLWRVPFRTGANRNALTPILQGDSVLFASHTTGMQKLRLAKSASSENPWSAQAEWFNRKLKINLSTPVPVDGFYYGLGAEKDYICVRSKEGEVAWSQPGFGAVASTISDGKRLLVLNDAGECLLLEATPQKYLELGRFQACGKTFSSPAWNRGVLYVRDSRELIAWPLVKMKSGVGSQ